VGPFNGERVQCSHPRCLPFAGSARAAGTQDCLRGKDGSTHSRYERHIAVAAFQTSPAGSDSRQAVWLARIWLGSPMNLTPRLAAPVATSMP
jgi:hypothetical protein